MEEANGTASAKLIKETAYTEVKIRDGKATVKVRGVGREELAATGIMAPIIDPTTGKKRENKKIVHDFTTGKDKYYASVRATIAIGMVDPKLWSGSQETCPENQVTIDDLGADQDLVFDAILNASGFTRELVKAANFRDTRGASGRAKKAGQRK